MIDKYSDIMAGINLINLVGQQAKKIVDEMVSLGFIEVNEEWDDYFYDHYSCKCGACPKEHGELTGVLHDLCASVVKMEQPDYEEMIEWCQVIKRYVSFAKENSMFHDKINLN